MIPLSGTIVINGVTYAYSLQAVGQGTAPAPIPFMPAGRPGGEEIHTVQVLSHQVKSGIASRGKMMGKRYEMHTFRCSDNRNYTTFKPEIAAKLSPIVGSVEPVKIIGIRDDRGGVRIVDVTV